MRNVSRASSGAAFAGAAVAQAAVAYAAAVLSLAACSSDATLYVQPYTEQPSAPNGPDTSGPAVFSAGGDPDSPADGPPVGVPGSEGPGESPGSVPPASSQEPEPNATETNFFTAGCRVDADCGATRRCEFFPPESVASDAGLSDAGAPDAAPSEPLGTRGRCVARVAQ